MEEHRHGRVAARFNAIGQRREETAAAIVGRQLDELPWSQTLAGPELTRQREECRRAAEASSKTVLHARPEPLQDGLVLKMQASPGTDRDAEQQHLRSVVQDLLGESKFSPDLVKMDLKEFGTILVPPEYLPADPYRV